MNRDAAFVWSCVNLLQVKSASAFTENGHASADGDGIDEKMIFIDQVIFNQARNESRASVGNYVRSVLVFEAAYFLDNVAFCQDGVRPGGFIEVFCKNNLRIIDHFLGECIFGAFRVFQFPHCTAIAVACD